METRTGLGHWLPCGIFSIPQRSHDRDVRSSVDGTLFLTDVFVHRYPNNNCAAQFGLGTLKYPQQEFPSYLNHDAGRGLIQPFLNSSAIAQSMGKPFMMFETNTASCGGFPGISNSFGAALWALDYGLIMAASNFSHAMLHIGGQNVYYNVSTIILLVNMKVSLHDCLSFF